MSESGSERASARRKNLATAYSNVNRDFSAMAAGSHGDHAPISIELGRNCRPSRTDDCESHRESEGAHTIANHLASTPFQPYPWSLAVVELDASLLNGGIRIVPVSVQIIRTHF
jgi:hypothetical protein